MGEAKRRGTFEERKATAVKRGMKFAAAMAEIERHKPSPKHLLLMKAIALLTVATHVDRGGTK